MKTLNDLKEKHTEDRYSCGSNCNFIEDLYYVDYDDLQDLAKEWIQQFEKEKKVSIVEDKRVLSELIGWINNFFNLEDE